MQEKMQLEAQVWGRILGQKHEEYTEKDDILKLLEQEYHARAGYLCLKKRLPQQAVLVQKLLGCTENNIKILKTMYYLEYGRCYPEKKCGNTEVFCACRFLREQYRRLKTAVFLREKRDFKGSEWEFLEEKWEHNRRVQSRLILCLLQGLL